MKWVLAAVGCLPLLGCAAHKPVLPQSITLRHMVCQRDTAAESPSVATCECRNPYWALNGKTGQAEIMCQK